MKRWVKVLISLFAVVAIMVASLFVVRAINHWRYFSEPDVEGLRHQEFDLTDASAYPLDTVDGVTITPVTGTHMAGFYFKPDTITRPGVTVSYGGSEGGAGWGPAVTAAQLGQESLALFFWGQPNQTPMLDEVPLEDFQEVLNWIDNNIDAPQPLIVAGGSKGAEYVANLLPRYDQIDHAIVIAPASYSFPALSYNQGHSSWTYQGQPVAYLPWESGGDEGSSAFIGALFKSLIGLPMVYGPSYEALLVHPLEEARIPIEQSQATIRAFAGEKDMLWPSATMAQQLKESAPERVEVTIYPGAGHMPGVPRYISGMDMGGSDEANTAAGKLFRKDLSDQIAAWAPENTQ